MNHLGAFGMLLCCAFGVRAEPTPLQYADGFPISAPPGAAVYRLTLDEAVYRSARHADLGDLRVFNGSDEALPHTLVRAASRETPAPLQALLPFYPLYESADQSTAGALHIAIAADGSIIDMRTPHAATDRLRAYIVDCGKDGASITGLDLQWQQPARGFVATVAVTSSDDLAAWRPVGSATLADLDHSGHRLQQQRIDFGQTPGRYLRIQWPEGREDMPLEAVHARLKPLEAPRPEQWTRIAGQAAQAPERGFLFDALGPLPADRARIVLEQDNTLVQLRWYSRRSPEALWHDHGSAAAYRLNLDGTMLTSPDVPLLTRRDRYWRVEVVDGDAAALGSTPRLELGWHADELLFMARGEPPFRLAAGSREPSNPGPGVDALLASLDQVQRASLVVDATLGERFTLGGEAALQPLRPPTPWQRYLLWAVLLTAVLLLGRMALNLYRELNTRN